MKMLKNSTLLMLAIALTLFACSPDHVAPTENANGNPSLAGAAGDAHPKLDTTCQFSDTLFLANEATGSTIVDRCFGAPYPGGPVAQITCPAGQLQWGYLVMEEGYYMDTSFIYCNFSLSPGWYCDNNNWQIGTGTSFQFTNNGMPVVGTDWTNYPVNPVQNKWRLRMRGNTLPACFDVALRVGAVRLNLFGAVTPSSNTVLWGRNRNWNQTGNNAASTSPWLMHFCPARCMETLTPPPPAIDTTRICEVVYKGLTCTGNNLNSTTLHPTTSETSAVTYLWGSGVTTQNITVSPTVTTSYTVGIKVGGVLKHVVIFNVNVIDVACTIGAGNGGGNNGSGHSAGNGGSHNGSHGGSGHNGSNGHDGGSGSQHHPGCSHQHNTHTACNNGNHQYGCNASHSGGNNNCNHRGHGYHCTRSHQGNKSCNGGHTMGCDGQHAVNASCQTRGGHKYNCNGQHSTGNCNTSVGHTQNCNKGNHTGYTACNNGHSHSHHGNGSGRGAGSGSAGGHSNGHANGSGHCGSGGGNGNGGNGGGGAAGVKVCHVPPGNPGGATTICVAYNQLSSHVTGVCSNNSGGGNGGGNGGGGNGGSGSGNGSNWGNGGNGSSHHGGNGHGCGGHTSNCNGHHTSGGCNNGHSGSGSGGSGSGHGSAQGSGSNSHGSGSNAHGTASHHGGGCQGGQGGGHTGDMIGACNSNPCIH